MPRHITHNSYNEQTWGVYLCVAMGSRHTSNCHDQLPCLASWPHPSLTLPIGPMLNWTNQLPLLRFWKWDTEQLSQLMAELNPGEWKPLCKVRYTQQPRGAEGSQSAERDRNQGLRSREAGSGPEWLYLQFHLFQRTFQGCKLVARKPNLAYRWILLDSHI